MKTFHFRLDQALRWRATQVEMEKSHVSIAARNLREIRAEIEMRRAELSAGASQLSDADVTGSSLNAWAAFAERTNRRIGTLERRALEAEQALKTRVQVLAEANRKLRLLENLKRRAKSQWQDDFNRDLEAFAGEAYLFRLQSRGKSGA